MAGIAGAWTQVVTHVGGAVCLAIQSAFSGNDNHGEWAITGQRGFIFMAGWSLVFAAQFFVPHLYRKLKGPSEEDKDVVGKSSGSHREA